MSQGPRRNARAQLATVTEWVALALRRDTETDNAGAHKYDADGGETHFDGGLIIVIVTVLMI